MNLRNKPILLTICGLSGSGKDVAAKYFRNKYNAHIICSCTTRPMRKGETNGVEHFFMTEERFRICTDISDILAHTEYGGYRYWTTVDQVYCTTSNLIVYIVDEPGLADIQHYCEGHNDFGWFLVNIIASDETRKKRMIPDEVKIRFERDAERIEWAMDNTDKYPSCDAIVINEGPEQELYSQLDKVYKKLKRLYAF